MPEKCKMIPMLFETVKIMEKLVHSMKRLLKNKISQVTKNWLIYFYALLILTFNTLLLGSKVFHFGSHNMCK